MMKSVDCLTALALLALAAPAPPDARAETVAPAKPTPIVTGTSYELNSTVLGDMRQINIWVPPDYATSARRYPVVYLLDGALDQDFHHIAGLANLASLSSTFGPFVLVGIQTRTRIAELTPMPIDARYHAAFPSSGDAQRFRAFLEKEVIPFVETTIRADGHRVLMGESLAGLFVIHSMLTRPVLFDDYVAISPSLWWDDRNALTPTRLDRQLKAAGRKRLYLAIANEGGTMQDGVDRLRRAIASSAPSNVETRYISLARQATHATIYHRAAEDALRWLFPAEIKPAQPVPWYMTRKGHPAEPRR